MVHSMTYSRAMIFLFRMNDARNDIELSLTHAEQNLTQRAVLSNCVFLRIKHKSIKSEKAAPTRQKCMGKPILKQLFPLFIVVDAILTYADLLR